MKKKTKLQVVVAIIGISLLIAITLATTQRDIRLDDIPAIADYTFRVSGSDYWAARSDGQIAAAHMGTNVATIFSSVMDLLAAQGGGHVHFTAGTYTISGAGYRMIVDEDNIKVTGTGKDTIFHDDNSLESWEITGAANVILEDFAIESDSAISEADALTIESGCENITVRGLYITNLLGQGSSSFEEGIMVYGGDYVTIENCRVEACDQANIEIATDSQHWKVMNNYLYYGIEQGIYIWSAQDGLISGNTIINSLQRGIYLYPTSGGGGNNTNIIITNNQIVGSGMEAINVAASGSGATRRVCTEITISNNIIETSSANQIAMSSDCENIIITHNIIRDGLGHGIYTSVNSPVIISHNLIQNHNNESTDCGITNWSGFGDYMTIDGNSISGSGQYGIYLIQANYTVITNNMIFENGADGIRFSGTDNSILSQNIVFANTGGGIILTATSSEDNVINDNRCFENGGTNLQGQASVNTVEDNREG